MGTKNNVDQFEFTVSDGTHKAKVNATKHSLKACS